MQGFHHNSKFQISTPNFGTSSVVLTQQPLLPALRGRAPGAVRAALVGEQAALTADRAEARRGRSLIR